MCDIGSWHLVSPFIFPKLVKLFTVKMFLVFLNYDVN